MTSHLEEGVLQELLDGEIPSAELGPIQEHLAGCAECRERLDKARAIGAEAELLIETLQVSDAAPAPDIPMIPRHRPRPWMRNVAWAATVLVAAGVGYMAKDTAVVRPTEEANARQSVVSPAVSSITPPEVAAAAPRPAPPATPRLESARREPTTLAKQPGKARVDGARDAAADKGAGAPANRAEKELKPTVVGALGQLAAAVDSDSVRKGKRSRSLGDSKLALDEIVVTAALEGRVASGVPAAAPPPLAPTKLRASAPESIRTNTFRLEETVVPAPTARAGLAPAPMDISLPEALKRLNGSIRLIEGVVPLRLEVLGSEVRVVYPLATGELLLVQKVENGRLTYRLVAPAGFPADSLDRLYARVHD